MTSFCYTAEAQSRFYSLRRHTVLFPPAWPCSTSTLLRKNLPAERCSTSPVHGYEGSAVPISCVALSLSLRVYFSLSFPSSSSHHLPRRRRTQPPSPSLCWHQRAVQPETCARVNHHLLRIKRSPAGLTIRVCDDWRSAEHLHGLTPSKHKVGGSEGKRLLVGDQNLLGVEVSIGRSHQLCRRQDTNLAARCGQ